MEVYKRFIPVLCLLLCSPPLSVDATNIWTNILTCVQNLANNTASVTGQHNPLSSPVGQANDTTIVTSENSTDGQRHQAPDFSMMRLFSIICGNKDEFVQCLDAGLKQSEDSIALLIGSQFDAGLVVRAYDGLCANISAIGDSGTDVLTCLTKAKLTQCQNEMADYFFYMGIIKNFAPPAEQLSRTTLETLLCRVTSQRRRCELQSLRQCSDRLASVMEEFYRQTQPASCAQMDKQEGVQEPEGTRDTRSLM